MRTLPDPPWKRSPEIEGEAEEKRCPLCDDSYTEPDDICPECYERRHDMIILKHKLSNLKAELIGVHNGMLIIINQGCIEEASPQFWELPSAEKEQTR